MIFRFMVLLLVLVMAVPAAAQTIDDTFPIVMTLEHPTGVWGLAISPDGTQIATGDNNGVLRVWDIASGEIVVELEREQPNTDGAIFSIDYSPDGVLIAAAHGSGAVYVWDVTTLRESATLRAALDAGSSPIFSTDFSADGTWLSAAAPSAPLPLWSVAGVESGRPNVTDVSASASSIAFSPDSRYLAIINNGGELGLWDVDAEQMRSLRNIGFGMEGYAVAFSPDSQTLAASGRDGILRVWSVEGFIEGEEPSIVLEEHTDSVTSIDFSSNGVFAASGSWDHTLRLWDVETWKSIAVFNDTDGFIFEVDFSADGRLLASSNSVTGVVTVRAVPQPR